MSDQLKQEIAQMVIGAQEEDFEIGESLIEAVGQKVDALSISNRKPKEYDDWAEKLYDSWEPGIE